MPMRASARTAFLRCTALNASGRVATPASMAAVLVLLQFCEERLFP